MAGHVSEELRRYFDEFFGNGCRWNGLLPVIEGSLERRMIACNGIIWLTLDLAAAELKHCADRIDGRIPRSPWEQGWSWQDHAKTVDFCREFALDVKAQVLASQDGQANAEKSAVRASVH